VPFSHRCLLLCLRAARCLCLVCVLALRLGIVGIVLGVGFRSRLTRLVICRLVATLRLAGLLLVRFYFLNCSLRLFHSISSLNLWSSFQRCVRIPISAISARSSRVSRSSSGSSMCVQFLHKQVSLHLFVCSDS